MATFLQFFMSLFCALLAAAVVMHGMHSKDLAALSIPTDLKVHAEEHSKVASDLHNHIDKQSFKSMVKASGDMGFQIDARSLRMLKQELLESRKFAQVKSWLAYLRAKLSMTFNLL